jgi:hypothetical protein
LPATGVAAKASTTGHSLPQPEGFCESLQPCQDSTAAVVLPAQFLIIILFFTGRRVITLLLIKIYFIFDC